ncbi:hypothetical protein EXIGLDRAFT_707035 [Exidia glandulosa HHB12029]|uniref:Uncharacterized protein n=1 Tax=Exidia glandulosa HHB12029 TaxID=1314781 RepID=A0A165AWC1_EXIGL|nr:hypothetical protein EXIGLDRAFT_707035 [Exidia glandulosa HHB12029]
MDLENIILLQKARQTYSDGLTARRVLAGLGLGAWPEPTMTSCSRAGAAVAIQPSSGAAGGGVPPNWIPPGSLSASCTQQLCMDTPEMDNSRCPSVIRGWSIRAQTSELAALSVPIHTSTDPLMIVVQATGVPPHGSGYYRTLLAATGGKVAQRGLPTDVIEHR